MSNIEKVERALGNCEISIRTSRFDKVAAVIFMVVIWLPFVGIFVDIDPTRNVNENRRLAKFPGVDGAKVSRTQLREYLKDHIGLRSAMVRTHGIVKYSIFHSASSPTVVVGKQGWLYYNHDNTVAAYTGDLPLSEEAVVKWQNTLSQRANFLAEQQIAYGIVMVPDKQFVYPEFLPDAIVQHPTGSYTHRLLERLDGGLPNVNVIQLFDAMQNAKRQGELFYQGDSHWNGRGIAAGYDGIITQLADFVPTMRQESPCSLSVIEHPNIAGQSALYRMAGVESIRRQPRVMVRPKSPTARIVAVPEEYYSLEKVYRRSKAIEAYENDSPQVQGRRLVMFHTSFTVGKLRPLLAEHFERVIFVRHSYNHVLAFHKQIIQRENPTVVLNEIPTRYLTVDPTTAYRTDEWNEPTSLVAGSRSEQNRREGVRKR